MFFEITTILLLAVYVYSIFTTIVFLLMENRNPVKSIAWIFVLIFIPVFGFFFYILVGKKFRKRHVISRRSFQNVKKSELQTGEVADSAIVPHPFQSLSALAQHNSDAVVCDGNSVEVYTDANLLYEDIFSSIASARHHIHLEYYIFISDDLGHRMMEALKAKAKEGIVVRVIVDDVGSWKLRKRDILDMRACGISVESFLEVGLPFIDSRVNYRNHRKMLIVDGVVAYTGGINIADRYLNGLSWGAWRDTHARIEGSAVAEFQKIFFADWYFVRQEMISDAVYFPASASKGMSLVQIVCSGPDMQWESIMQVYVKAFSLARKSIYIETPYFLPPESVITALQTASLSGVDVRIILPKRSDAKFTLVSSYSYLDQMFKAGVKIYFYQDGFIHSKLTVVDDEVAFLGSANMDFRSFEHNFEMNTILYDPTVANRLSGIFMEDIASSVEQNEADWKKRPTSQKLKESVARLFSPLL